jgi:hypothetical protein
MEFWGNETGLLPVVTLFRKLSETPQDSKGNMAQAVHYFPLASASPRVPDARAIEAAMRELAHEPRA